ARQRHPGATGIVAVESEVAAGLKITADKKPRQQWRGFLCPQTRSVAACYLRCEDSNMRLIRCELALAACFASRAVCSACVAVCGAWLAEAWADSALRMAWSILALLAQPAIIATTPMTAAVFSMVFIIVNSLSG